MPLWNENILEQTKADLLNVYEVEITITKYRNHPSRNAITEKMEKLGNSAFGFDSILYEETVKQVNNLKSRKFSQKQIFL